MNLCLTVLTGNIVKASYPTLHAFHLPQQRTIVGLRGQHSSSSLEQASDSFELRSELGSIVTSSEDYDDHPQYSFAYDVKDTLSGDDKQQEEQRDGDVVQGQVNYIIEQL